MSNLMVRVPLPTLVVLAMSLVAAAQTSPKPMHASEVLAMQAGGVLDANIVREVVRRRLNFHPDANYLAQLKNAGADAAVLEAVANAKVVAEASSGKPDQKLLERLGSAATLIRDKRYDEATSELSTAIKEDFAGPEAGFVMGELLRRQEEWPQAAAVYSEVLRESPDFPQVHTKLSLVLYKMGDAEGALHEAKTALAQNHEDAEAHKNAGLALDDSQKFDAAVAEYREALRLKPDYAPVHFNLGLLLSHAHDYDGAISEYKKAIALNPDSADAHTNLGLVYAAKGDLASAIREQREAKRLDPNDSSIRQNLASALMATDPQAAKVELQELSKLSPDSESCHQCLAKALRSTGDIDGAQKEYRKAIELDPSDPEPHLGLGNIEEDNKGNLDAALEEYQAAERLGGDLSRTHRAVGRILLTKKEVLAALAELQQAETLSPSDWETHDLYAQALAASGENDKAIAELKDAVSLDPKQSQVILELASALEKKGDWVGALEQYRKAKLAEASGNTGHPNGEAFIFRAEAQKAYGEARRRFQAHVASLKAKGKDVQAAQLEQKVRGMESTPSIRQRAQLDMERGDQAVQEQRFDDADKFYKEAIDLAAKLPAGGEILIEALGHLANTYSMRQEFAEAVATFQRQLRIAEKTFGPQSPRVTATLFALGSLAGGLKDYLSAEKYFSQILAIDLKTYGENSSKTAESLRSMAGILEAQSEWEKAEPFMLRSVKAQEAVSGPNDYDVLRRTWSLCSLYDFWDKPGKSQPCWQRVSEIAQKQPGENSAEFQQSLTNEAKALRHLGRNDEADKLEQRAAKIKNTSMSPN